MTAPQLFPTGASVPNLADYDVILINTSAGKDSQTMLRLVHGHAVDQGVTDRLVAVHADLGRVEWKGTKELAAEQAAHYGIRFETVSREQGDLLDAVEERRAMLVADGREDVAAWPSSAARYCTSDHKRGQVRKLMTGLVREVNARRKGEGLERRPVRILNCMGMRRQESTARSKKVELRYDAAASGKGTVRQVDEWLPILDWTEDDVWADIETSGVRYHWAYDLGMSRLSCCFCVLASRDDLVIAARANPDLAAEYVAVELRVGSKFKADLSMAEVVAEAAEVAA